MHWVLTEVAVPKRIIAAAEVSGDEETECMAAYMMRASKNAGGSYFEGLAYDWADVDPDKFDRYFVESRDFVAADKLTSEAEQKGAGKNQRTHGILGQDKQQVSRVPPAMLYSAPSAVALH